MANVARLGVVMGLDTAEFTSGLQAVDKQLERFKERLIEFASVAVFAEMTRAAMEFAGTIVKTAKANDVTTASVLQLSKALEENGGSAEETSRIYAGFNQKVETAALGSEKAQESFARLGVSLNDIRTLSSQDLFEKTIVGLAKINDSVTRNGLAFQTLGKGIRGVDIVGLAHTIEETKGMFEKYSLSVNQAHELHLKMEASGRKINLLFTDAFIPNLKIIYDDLTKTNGMLEAFFSKLKLIGEGTAILYAAIKLDIQIIVTSIMALNDAIYNFSTGGLDAMRKGWMNSQNEARLAVSGYHELLAKIKEVNTASGEGGPKGDEKQNRQIIQSNAAKINAAKQLTDEYKKQQNLQLQMVIDQRNLLALTNDQKVVQQAVNKVIDENKKARDAIDKQIAAAEGQGAAGAALIRVLKQQKEAIFDLQSTYVDATIAETEATINFQKSYSFGWNKAFSQFREDTENNARITEEMFTSAIGSMNSAIDTFVTKGKLDFASLATSILQDIEKIILKAMVMRAITGMGNAMGLGGYGSGTEGSFNFIGPPSSLMASASGGPLSSGQASIVGENGPELFIPKNAGTVIPNSGNLSGVGSTTNVTNNYIQAIDTKSFEERLYGSNKAIWAANQYADKNLAMSRSRT